MKNPVWKKNILKQQSRFQKAQLKNSVCLLLSVCLGFPPPAGAGKSPIASPIGAGSATTGASSSSIATSTTTFSSGASSFALAKSAISAPNKAGRNQKKEKVLIYSADTEQTEFLAYIKTEPVKTYAQYQLERNRITPRPVNIQALLKQAQMEFLSHDPQRSKRTFQLIAEHTHSFDWNTEERKIIFYSLLRLTQLEQDQQKKRLLLREALVFGMGLKIDPQIFPPPVMELYQTIRSKATSISLSLKKLFPRHDIVLINGKAHTHGERVTLPYGMYRVTALSSSHKSSTRVLSLSNLISKPLKTPALAVGSCQKPVLNNVDTEQKEVHILFPNFCVWSPAPTRLKVTQQESKTDLNASLPVDIQIAEEELTAPKKTTEWWEEEWLWLSVAVGVGVVGAVVLLRKDKNKSPEQTEQKPKPQIKIGF